MTTTTKVARLAAGAVVTGVAGIALAGPATAVPIPCDKPPCGFVEPSAPIPTGEQAETPSTGLYLDQVALGALGGAAVTGAGVVTVVLLRRRSDEAPRPV